MSSELRQLALQAREEQEHMIVKKDNFTIFFEFNTRFENYSRENVSLEVGCAIPKRVRQTLLNSGPASEDLYKALRGEEEEEEEEEEEFKLINDLKKLCRQGIGKISYNRFMTKNQIIAYRHQNKWTFTGGIISDRLKGIKPDLGESQAAQEIQKALTEVTQRYIKSNPRMTRSLVSIENVEHHRISGKDIYLPVGWPSEKAKPFYEQAEKQLEEIINHATDPVMQSMAKNIQEKLHKKYQPEQKGKTKS